MKNSSVFSEAGAAGNHVREIPITTTKYVKPLPHKRKRSGVVAHGLATGEV